MLHATFVSALAAFGLISAGGVTEAQETVKIGLILPMTGQQTTTGKQIEAAVRLYVRQHGVTVAGKKIEIILRDDAAIPENTKRIAQELIVNEHVNLLAGFGVTPSAFVVAPLATQAKIATIVMAAGTSTITQRSPYIVRTSFTLAQTTSIIAEWAAKNGIKRVVTLVNDFAPGIEAETSFREHFGRDGRQVVEAVRVPLANPDFAPFLQRASDVAPDAIFAFVVSGQGAIFAKQYIERGLNKSGIKLLGTGALTDDDVLPRMSDTMIGTVTAHFYSAAHPSAANKTYVEAFKKSEPGLRPNFFSVGGYDGMHLIYEALRKTSGATDGDSLVEAMKGMTWESPRGPISIDPDTRDIVQNVYVSRVEKINGELYNVEFATFEAVRDPVKATKK
jgi:branched-chain amino acid transport system substrate-binding protein